MKLSDILSMLYENESMESVITKDMEDILNNISNLTQLKNILNEIKKHARIALFYRKDDIRAIITDITQHKHNLNKIYLEINNGERYIDIKLSDIKYNIGVFIKVDNTMDKPSKVFEFKDWLFNNIDAKPMFQEVYLSSESFYQQERELAEFKRQNADDLGEIESDEEAEYILFKSGYNFIGLIREADEIAFEEWESISNPTIENGDIDECCRELDIKKLEDYLIPYANNSWSFFENVKFEKIVYFIGETHYRDIVVSVFGKQVEGV